MVINIRKYYIFKIKGENLKVSTKNINNILEELFFLSTNKFNYGEYVFNNLCINLNKDLILNFLKQKYESKDNYIFIKNLENTKVLVKHTFILIETNKNAPSILKYLNELEKNLFVCDFQNKDYFWLNEFVRLNLKISI